MVLTDTNALSSFPLLSKLVAGPKPSDSGLNALLVRGTARSGFSLGGFKAIADQETRQAETFLNRLTATHLDADSQAKDGRRPLAYTATNESLFLSLAQVESLPAFQALKERAAALGGKVALSHAYIGTPVAFPHVRVDITFPA